MIPPESHISMTSLARFWGVDRVWVVFMLVLGIGASVALSTILDLKTPVWLLLPVSLGLTLFDPALLPLWFLTGFFFATQFMVGIGVEHGLLILFTMAFTFWILYRQARFDASYLRAALTLPAILTLLLTLYMFLTFFWTSCPQAGLVKITGFAFTNVGSVMIFTLLPASLAVQRRVWIYIALLGLALGIGVFFVAMTLPLGFRVGAFGIDPIWSARLIGISALFFVYEGLRRKGLVRWLCWSMILVLFLLSLPTASRGPTLAMFLGIGLIIFTAKSLNLRMRALIVGGLVLTMLVTIVLLPGIFFYRFKALEKKQDNSSLVRLYFWYKSFEKIRESHLLGIGAGGFARLIVGRDVQLYPHNIFLEIALEFGIIGLLLFLSLLGLTARNLWILIWKARDRLSSEEFAYAQLLMALFLFAFLNAQLSGDVVGNAFLWMVMGAIHAYRTNRVPADPSTPSPLPAMPSVALDA